MKKLVLVLTMVLSMSAVHFTRAVDHDVSETKKLTGTSKKLISEGRQMKKNTSRSDKIVQNYRQSKTKYKRKSQKFSGTWETTTEELFPLFCPAREADWIPGWDCQLIYTESGYAEDKVVFKTDKSNPAGEGLWTFTGYKLNSSVEFVRFQQDILMHAKITLADNKDGTTTATWNVVFTALTEKGNKKLDSMFVEDGKRHGPVEELIDHYLRKGKLYKKNHL